VARALVRAAPRLISTLVQCDDNPEPSIETNLDAARTSARATSETINDKHEALDLVAGIEQDFRTFEEMGRILVSGKKKHFPRPATCIYCTKQDCPVFGDGV